VKQGQEAQEHVPFPELWERIGPAEPFRHRVQLGEHDPLRKTGGPRGVHDRRQVIDASLGGASLAEPVVHVAGLGNELVEGKKAVALGGHAVDDDDGPKGGKLLQSGQDFQELFLAGHHEHAGSAVAQDVLSLVAGRVGGDSDVDDPVGQATEVTERALEGVLSKQRHERGLHAGLRRIHAGAVLEQREQSAGDAPGATGQLRHGHVASGGTEDAQSNVIWVRLLAREKKLGHGVVGASDHASDELRPWLRGFRGHSLDEAAAPHVIEKREGVTACVGADAGVTERLAERFDDGGHVLQVGRSHRFHGFLELSMSRVRVQLLVPGLGEVAKPVFPASIVRLHPTTSRGSRLVGRGLVRCRRPARIVRGVPIARADTPAS
jgi:hypothetical protein